MLIQHKQEKTQTNIKEARKDGCLIDASKDK